MKMDDNELKRLLQEGMEYEADCIMEEVNSDPNVKDVIAPEDLHENLMKQIQEHEEAKEKERENEAKEEQELIRLGKIYKKKRARRKYIVLIAAVVCALAVGTISFGDGKKVFTEIQRRLGDREQSVVNTDDSDGTVVDEIASEEEAYEQINEKFGFYPVKIIYLPEGMEFIEISVEENLQLARLCYADDKEGRLTYRIITKNRTTSSNTDVEDKFIQEYSKEINGVVINIQEYLVEETNVQRWKVSFTYEEAQYSMIISGMQGEEVDKIVENLFFS